MLIEQEVLLGTDVTKTSVPSCPPNAILRFSGLHNGIPIVFGVTPDQLNSHLLLLGSTSSGKTNTIKEIISQIKSQMTNDDIMIIFDSKYDFREFHSPGDYVISTRKSDNAINVNWNVFGDITADGWEKDKIIQNSHEISQVAYIDRIRNSTQEFFPQAASNVFAAVMAGMSLIGKEDKDYRKKHLNNATLKEYLNKLDANMLADFLRPFPDLYSATKYVGTGKSDQALGVFAELQVGVEAMFSSNFGLSGAFSVRRQHRARGGKSIFVEYDPSCGAYGTGRKVLMDLFLKESLSPEYSNGRKYIVVDEFKLLSVLLYFEDALNFSRSLGTSVLAGLQSVEQLYELYGEYGGKNIASGFQSSFVFRTNNKATRDYIKEKHGKNLSTIQYLDASNKPQNTTREGFVVEDWNVSSLKLGEAIVSLPSSKPFIFQFDKY